MDDVQVWDSALSQEQIHTNMNLPLIGNETGLVGYWNFNDGEVSILSNPLKIFEYNQQFEVELQVENEFSCKDTIIKTLEIPKFKPVFIPNIYDISFSLFNFS